MATFKVFAGTYIDLSEVASFRFGGPMPGIMVTLKGGSEFHVNCGNAQSAEAVFVDFKIAMRGAGHVVPESA